MVHLSSHNHTCQHHHPVDAQHGKAFIIGIGLNSVFIIAELIYGFQANSLALLADAWHNVSDVMGLCMVWGATLLANRLPSTRYTYGLQSSSIIAALANAVLLLVAVGGMSWEAIERFSHPQTIAGTTVMCVAALGVVINGITAMLFMTGRKSDMNIRGAFIHMASDALISLGVVCSGFIILNTGWLWVDPFISLTIGLVIIAGTWGLLKDSFNLALHAVPTHIDPLNVKAFLQTQQGVEQVHDLHIWAMSTTTSALSVHLLMPAGHPGDCFIVNLCDALKQSFDISHATIQIEIGDSRTGCALAPDHVI